MITSMRSSLLSLAYAAGLGLVYAGERLAGAGVGRAALTGGGLALVLFATALRAVRAARTGPAGDARRGVERGLLALQLAGVLGALLYLAQSDLFQSVAGKDLGALAPKLAGSLAALYPAAIAAALVPLFFAELAYAAMARAPRVEAGRVREAMFAGLGVVGALVFAFSAVYVADALDVRANLSRFRTAAPGEATRRIAAGLSEPVEVSLFFPPANEVREQVAEYFTDLNRETGGIKVSDYDQAVDLAKARELKVSANGVVAFTVGGRTEKLHLGIELEKARAELRELDKNVNKRLLLLTRPQRVAYFVTGHGERLGRTPEDQRESLEGMREVLAALNVETKNLTAAEGLASEVPPDAGMVLLLGPQQPLLPEEADALARYFERGGRLLVALDPEARGDQAALLGRLGLRFEPTLLVNETAHFRRTGRPSDRAILATGSFSSHPSVSSLSGLSGRAYVAMPTSGSLAEAEAKPAGVSVHFTVHALPTTGADRNGNFSTDPGEPQKAWELVAAVTRSGPPAARGGPAAGDPAEAQGRAVVLADADALSDFYLQNVGNAYLGLDAIKWLNGEEAIAGVVSSETDRPIAHTRKQDLAWFYSTIFGVPGLILGAGFLVTRRRRPRARRAATSEPPQGEVR